MIDIIKTRDGNYLPVIGKYVELSLYEGMLHATPLYIGLDPSFRVSIRTSSIFISKDLDPEIRESVYKQYSKFIDKNGKFKSKYIRKFRRMLIRLNYNNYYRVTGSKELHTLGKWPKVNTVKKILLEKRQDLKKFILKVGETRND
jgi:hypothetical protein